MVLKAIGGGAGDCFMAQNMCCRMNCCLSHAFLKQVICFASLYQSDMPQKDPVSS